MRAWPKLCDKNDLNAIYSNRSRFQYGKFNLSIEQNQPHHSQAQHSQSRNVDRLPYTDRC